jgi:hypothetical protein
MTRVSHFALPAAACCIAFVIAAAAPAHAAVLRSFDQVFQGDDPGEVFEFNLPFDPAQPAVVSFEGFAENLEAGADSETGVRFHLRWRPPTGDGGGDGGGADLPDESPFPRGVRLPPADPLSGPVRVPLHFESLLAYSPSLLIFAVEGLGPTDNFRLAGDLSIRPVPEPAPIAFGAGFLVAATTFSRTWRRR